MAQILGTSTLMGDAGSVSLMGGSSGTVGPYVPPFSPASIANLGEWLDAFQGVQNDGAAQFSSASGTYLSNAALKPSGAFATGGWFYVDSAGPNSLICQFSSLASKLGNFQLQVDAGNGVHFSVFNQGVEQAEVVYTSISSGAWYHVSAWYSAATARIYLKINNLAILSTTVPFTPTFTDGATFALGARAGNNAIEILNGREDSCWFYSGEFSEQMALDLWNNGAGCTYASSPASVQSGLVSWWDLNEASASAQRFDRKGPYHLTPSATSGGGPTPALGIVVGAASDGDPVSRWLDVSGAGKHAVQATLTNKPTYTATGVNGRPGVQCDGVDDRLIAPFTSNQPLTILAALKLPSSFTENVSDILIGNAQGAASNLVIELNAPNNVAMFAGANGPNVPVTLGSACVVTAMFATTSTALTINGGTPVAGSAGNNGLLGGLALGCLWGGSYARHSAPTFGEVLIYTRALSLAERSQIENYLKSKWGIA